MDGRGDVGWNEGRKEERKVSRVREDKREMIARICERISVLAPKKRSECRDSCVRLG